MYLMEEGLYINHIENNNRPKNKKTVQEALP